MKRRMNGGLLLLASRPHVVVWPYCTKRNIVVALKLILYKTYLKVARYLALAPAIL